MAVPAPSRDAEGFVTLEALRAYGRSVSTEAFAAQFPAPALQVTAVEAKRLGGGPQEPTVVERSIRPTIVSEEEEDVPSRRRTQRFGTETGATRYQKKVAFLVKRPGNPFPQMISVGRAMNNDVALMLGSVSKMHGFFMLEGQTWSFTDRRSTNGTTLNGTRLEPDKKYPIKDGETLRIGLELVATFLVPQSLYLRLRFG